MPWSTQADFLTQNTLGVFSSYLELQKMNSGGGSKDT